MDAIYKVAEEVASIFDAMTALMFFVIMLGKRDRIKSKGLFTVTVILYILILGYFQDASSDVVVQFASVIILELVFECGFLKGSLGNKLICIMLHNVVLVITNLLTVHGMSILLGCEMEKLCQTGTTLRIQVLLVNKVLILFVLLIITLLGKRNQFEYQEWLIAVLMLFGTLLTGAVLADIAKSGRLRPLEEMSLIAVAFGLLAISIGIVFCLYQLNRQHYYKIENQLLNAKLDDEKFMMEKIEKMHEDNRILRHDLKHYFTVVHGMLENSSQEEIKAYLEDVIESKIDSRQIYRTNSSVINAVLNDKAALCDREKITFQVQISGEIPEEYQLNLGVVLSNLLDNAIEAERKEEKKEIAVEMYWQGEMFFLQIANEIEKSVLSTNLKLATSKTDSRKHGLGIKSVKKLVTEMSGMYICEEEDKKFIVKVILPISGDR